MNARRSVLIVDGSEETREVLRTALEQRGLRIFAASRAEAGLKLARQVQPDLIVLDLEVEPHAMARLADRFAHESRREETPLVLLGEARRRDSLPPGERVAKPYHYAPLIRKIEELLDGARQLSAAG